MDVSEACFVRALEAVENVKFCSLRSKPNVCKQRLGPQMAETLIACGGCRTAQISMSSCVMPTSVGRAFEVEFLVIFALTDCQTWSPRSDGVKGGGGGPFPHAYRGVPGLFNSCRTSWPLTAKRRSRPQRVSKLRLLPMAVQLALIVPFAFYDFVSNAVAIRLIR